MSEANWSTDFGNGLMTSVVPLHVPVGIWTYFKSFRFIYHSKHFLYRCFINQVLIIIII